MFFISINILALFIWIDLLLANTSRITKNYFYILGNLFYSKFYLKIYCLFLNTRIIKNKIFRPFNDILLLPCIKIRAIREYVMIFSRSFLGARFSSYFTSAFDNGSSDPERETDENRSLEEETRKWGSLYGTMLEDERAKKVGQTAQLPLGTCSARRYLSDSLAHFPLSSDYLKSAR